MTTKFIFIVIAIFVCIQTIASEKPNVIIIFNDDQGYQDLGCFGSPDIKTPNVDQLAEQGMRFTDFYVASPVCSASRASLLTGFHPYKTNVQGVLFPNNGGGLNTELKTIADVLKTTGYATAAIGKWHLGEDEQFLPTSRGFDHYYGIPYSNDMFPSKLIAYSDNCVFREGYSMESLNTIFKNGTMNQHRNKVPLMRNLECIEYPCDQTTITKRYTDESIRFIEQSVNDEEPFFLYLANTMPHIPLFSSPEFEGVSEDGPYGDVIEEIDYNVGRIMEKLDELDISDNTIIMVTSDNGPWLSVGKDKSGNADPFFEGKFTCFEGGMRVPFVIRWPEQIPAGSSNSEIASTLDILPTLANIAGAEIPDKNIDGKDILDLWTAAPGYQIAHQYYFYINQGLAVRSGDWKYHLEESFSVKKTARPTGGPTLYNLKNDPGESVNLIEQYPEIADSLSNALMDFMQEINLETRIPRDTVVNIPGKVEAEAYSEQNGIRLVDTSDDGGGQNVGFIDTRDWFLYQLNAQESGKYVVHYRVASPAGGGEFQLENEKGDVLSTIVVPKTNGWQNWVTVQSDTISIEEKGVHKYKVLVNKGSFNINWMDFSLMQR